MKKLLKVKEFSELTGVTVRTLHHYDRKGLLSPKQKTESGYRLYSEGDMLRLQQILTLKFLGLSLTEIKQLIDLEENNLLNALKMQAAALAERLEDIKIANDLLSNMVSNLEQGCEVSWDNTVNFIKVMKMSDDKMIAWCRENLSADENKKLGEIWSKYDDEFRKDYDQRWAKLFDECAKVKNEDPTGPIGLEIGKKGWALINEVWGDNLELSKKLWQMSKEESPMRDNIKADDKTVEFYDKAVNNYIINVVKKNK